MSTSNNGFHWWVDGRYKEFELKVVQQRTSIMHSGAVAFEFRHITPGHSYSGCLVGGEKMYRYTTYEYGPSPNIQLFGSTNPQDIAEVSDLAKALVGQTFEPHHIADNLGDYVWVVTVGPERPSMFGSIDSTLLLKSYGNVEGELSDPRALKLVALLNKWCPDANFAAQQQAMEHKRHETARALDSRRASLSRSNALLLEYWRDTSGYGGAGCLIGGDAALLYNLRDGVITTRPIDPGEIDKSSPWRRHSLEKRLFPFTPSMLVQMSWIATIENTSVILKKTGASQGAFEGGISDPRAQELIAIIDRWCPDADLASQRQAFAEKVRKFEAELDERTASMRQAGPTFEFHYLNGAWGYANAGCIIGEGGNVYTFNFEQTPFFQPTGRVSDPEYNRSIELAKSVGGHEYTPQRAMVDGGSGWWTVTVDGVPTRLKETVDTRGELADPAAAELVKFIAQWCLSYRQILVTDWVRRQRFELAI